MNEAIRMFEMGLVRVDRTGEKPVIFVTKKEYSAYKSMLISEAQKENKLITNKDLEGKTLTWRGFEVREAKHREYGKER